MSHVATITDAAEYDAPASEVWALPWGLLSYAARGKLDELADGRSRLTWRGTLAMNENGADLDRVRCLLRKSYARMLFGIRQVVER